MFGTSSRALGNLGRSKPSLRFGLACNVSIPSAKIVSLALGFYNQWWDALGQHTSVLSNQDVYSASRWRKLASGFFKYNTDASMIPRLV